MDVGHPCAQRPAAGGSAASATSPTGPAPKGDTPYSVIDVFWPRAVEPPKVAVAELFDIRAETINILRIGLADLEAGARLDECLHSLPPTNAPGGTSRKAGQAKGKVSHVLAATVTGA
ncbi:hypothetical protein Franean1_2891 [Parafrankia sp. EAN1pec]|nr:hypothetical protein Franean1_2891 [Frankia sp. EAN1pec]